MYANQKKNLLIIDSDIQNRNEIKSLLSDEYNIIETCNISEGESVLKTKDARICAILVSATILRLGADSLFKLIQDTTDLLYTPVLILIDEFSSLEEFNLLGIDIVDCIEKPYNSYIIKNRIKNAIILKDSIPLYGIEKMLKELPSNIYLKDREGRYIFATHYWHHLEHNNDPDWTIRGKTDPEIRKDKENAIEAMEKDKELIATGQGTSYTIEINADGIQEFFNVIKQPVYTDDGKINGIIGLINNVTDYELMKRELEARSRTDTLTGLYNRTYFYEYLENLCNQKLYPISVIYADCDGLKRVNDTYGHIAGDEYIQKTVELFNMVLPKECAKFRFGGDEFIIILPSTSKEETLTLVEQMKNNAKQFNVKEQVLSISFGVSCLNDAKDSIEDCLSEADKKMYKDKKKNHIAKNKK